MFFPGMEKEYRYLQERNEELGKIFSPTFCFAKWYHANIYLQSGETHSCYHPAPHPIDAEQVAQNPLALHNTAQKITERQFMLQGQRPKGCQYCWNLEDLPGGALSDRIIRSGSIYRDDLVREVKDSPWNFDVIPEYVEISFSNECHFKCGYCHPKASSRYYQEIKQHGPYPGVKHHPCNLDGLRIYPEDDNPYLRAWWDWWPTLLTRLKILRITGGEPLLQKSTFRVLDLLRETPRPELDLKINSNLGSKPDRVKIFCKQVAALESQGAIKSFELFTSMDTWGPRAEYIRYGLDLATFEANLFTYLETTSSPVTIMITYNLFSVSTFRQLLEKILAWRARFPNAEDPGAHRVRFDLAYLKEPLQYDIHILPKEEYLPYVNECLRFAEANLEDGKADHFSFMDLQRLKRLHLYFQSSPLTADRIAEGRRDHHLFFDEMDRRRSTSRHGTFPEMNPFFELCAQEAAKPKPDPTPRRSLLRRLLTRPASASTPPQM